MPMSKQRLSKLQKWILENCFRVTILLDRSMLKELNNTNCSRHCRKCPKTNENVRLERNTEDFISPKCVAHADFCSHYEFYKEDILLSYYSLKPSYDKAHINRAQHFHDSADYAKAHVSVHRSLNNLVEKGLIYIGSTFREDSLQISLTYEGMRKAAELLNINDTRAYEPLYGR